MPMLRTIERPTNATLRSCACRDVQHLLHAVHVGGEAGDDDPPLGLAKTASSTGPISRSGVTKPGHLGVGGVDQEQVDALLAEPGEAAAGR